MKPVTIEVSGVLPSPPAGLWKLISGFSDTRDYRIPDQNDEQEPPLLPQRSGTSRGGIKRTVYIGNGRLCEELTLLDHERYAILRLLPVTMSKETFIIIQSSFKTEVEMVGIMRAKWQQIYEGLVQSLHKGLPSQQGQGLGTRTLSPAALSSRFSSPLAAGPPLATAASLNRLPVILDAFSTNEDHLQGDYKRSPLTLSLYPGSSATISPERCPAPMVNFPNMYAPGASTLSATGGSTLSGHYSSMPSEVVRQNLAELRRASSSSVDATCLPDQNPSPEHSFSRWLSLPSVKLFAESIKK